IGGYPRGVAAFIILPLLAAPGLFLLTFASGAVGRQIPWSGDEAEDQAESEDFSDEEDEDDSGVLAIGAITHWFLSARAFVRRHTRQRQPADDMLLERAAPVTSRGRVEPEFGMLSPSPEPHFEDDDDYDYEEEEDFVDEAPPSREVSGRAAARVAAPAPRPQQGARVRRE